MKQKEKTSATTPEQDQGLPEDIDLLKQKEIQVDVDLEANISDIKDDISDHKKNMTTKKEQQQQLSQDENEKRKENRKLEEDQMDNNALSEVESSESNMFELESHEAFYDPLTKKIMIDPVVHPNGTSFEMSTAIEMDDSLTYYPNRALKSIIEAEIPATKMEEESNSPSEEALTFSLRKFDESIRSGLSYLFDTKKPLPDAFYCPITYELISFPVIDPDGNTYEKAAIYHWIQANGTSPITRESLQIDQLYQNKALFDIIDSEAKRPEESIRSSFRRWKEEKTNLDAEIGTNSVAASSTATAPEEIDQSIMQRFKQNGWKISIMLLVLIVTYVVCTMACSRGNAFTFCSSIGMHMLQDRFLMM